MNLLRLAAQIFLIYLVYKLVVNVIIPIYRSTKQIKKQFGEMKENMQNMQGNSNAQTPPVNKTQNTSTKPEKEGDYIDFEEVKSWKFSIQIRSPDICPASLNQLTPLNKIFASSFFVSPIYLIKISWVYCIVNWKTIIL